MRGTLNSFQKLMLQWRAVHPLNAVHAVKLEGGGDPDRLRRALDRALDRLGLKGLAFDPARGYEYGRGDPPVEADVPTHPTLDGVIASELNRPFPPPPYNPLRAFAYPEEDGHYIGITYDHWSADAMSIMPALALTLAGYLGAPLPAFPVENYPPTLRPLIARHLTNGTGARVALRALRTYANLRRARRVHHIDAADLHNAYLIRRVEPGTYDQIRQAAAGVGATVHDLCMAAMALALTRHLPPYRRRSRRSIGIGSVADLRGLVPRRWARAHGVMLCYITLVLDRPKHHDLLTLTRKVRQITTPLKRDHTYLSSLINFGFGALVGPHVPLKTSLKFALRNMPLGGGVSSFRLLPAMTPEPVFSRIRAYVRGVSTGPSVPFVAQASKLRDDMTFGISYRTTAVDPDLASRIADEFVHQVESVLRA